MEKKEIKNIHFLPETDGLYWFGLQRERNWNGEMEGS